MNDAVDCLPVFHLLDQAQARWSRNHCHRHGGRRPGYADSWPSSRRVSNLCFTRETNERPRQAKQYVEELSNVYRVENITRETAITGLVGCPVSHSISPQIHNAAFASLGTDAVYIPFEVRDLKAFFEGMVHPRTRRIDWRMRGLSITAPHKTEVLAELDWIEPVAREIGAVNTVVVEDDRLCGYNTDAAAFVAPLRDRLGSLSDVRVALIGAGGVASAALYSLKQEKAQTTIFARDTTESRSARCPLVHQE